MTKNLKFQIADSFKDTTVLETLLLPRLIDKKNINSTAEHNVLCLLETQFFRRYHSLLIMQKTNQYNFNIKYK